jgi:hypothetical protein
MDASDAGADRIREIERVRLRSLVTPDLELARSLHADDYQLITPGGRTYSKEEYLGGIESGELDYLVFEPTSEISVLARGEIAIVRYQVAIEMRFPGGRDEGRFWHTDVYDMRDGRWQAVWSQATRIPAEG